MKIKKIKFKKNNMEKNKWIKMSEQQPQIDDWYTHYYVGVNKHGVLIIFTGMADVSGDGNVIEHWSYETASDCVDFKDIDWWMELPKRPDNKF